MVANISAPYRRVPVIGVQKLMQLPKYQHGLALLAVATIPILSAWAQTPPGGAAAPAAVRQAGKLVLHRPVERELGPGQTDLFAVAVAAGLFLHVEAEKKGVDVVLVLADPQGKPLATADSPNGAFGPVPASLIAASGGEYQIRVAKSPRSSETGRYRIALTDLHSPTRQDRARLQAETEFYAAVANERAQDRERRVQAIAGYERAAALWHPLRDVGEEALCLHRIGAVYTNLRELRKALDYYNQALPLRRAAGDRAGEARTLANIGTVYSRLRETQKALDYYDKTLLLMRSVGDRAGEEGTLINIGVAYVDLGETQKALDYSNQALLLERAAGNQVNEAAALTNIGNRYRDLGEKQKALDYYNQALLLERAVGNRASEAATLDNIGEVYSDLGEKQKALDYYNQALTLERRVGNRADEAETLINIGKAYAELGETQKALNNYTQALQLAGAVSDPANQGRVLTNLMRYWRAQNHTGLAILCGKQAVNHYQDLRRNIQGLDPQLQRSYLATVSETYRSLADLLIAEGRLAEAEQILSLLKEQEYFEYVRQDAAEASSVEGHANLSPEEAEWDRRYQDAAAANVAFDTFFADLAQRFNDKPAVHVEQLPETQGILEDLRELPAGTVAIYTLVGADKFRAILRTPSGQQAYEYPIKAADLNRKVLAFRQAAKDPKLDPLPLAEELYRIVVGPMAADLREAQAQTLMWSLDGVLRYLPLAALYDGHHYLIERYRLSVMTLASNARLKDRPDREWKGAGFGVTKAYEGLPPLPLVSAELSSIIATKPGDGGVLAGEIKLNGAFTEQALRETLRKGYAVVHIASHFRFQPGNEAQSYLLLGDGAHLSMAELNRAANLFDGVQLLTLSACDTGMGDGTEVEGFGALAERQGAKAVIASLWPVADSSTKVLMQKFYRIRESSPGKTKLEALREAQLELLGRSGNGVPKSPYAHPYYWAPFFLMGNWL
jgi:CHAT domain-containing protein